MQKQPKIAKNGEKMRPNPDSIQLGVTLTSNINMFIPKSDVPIYLNLTTMVLWYIKKRYN